MSEALTPSVGWGVLHLFCKLRPDTDGEAVVSALKAAASDAQQVVPFSVFGHKADLGIMALGEDLVRLRALQSALQAARLEVADSYLSLTEVSEYAKGMPPEHLEARLHPVLPPAGKRAICFYPMSKRRGDQDNWYTLDFESRKALMMDHGKSGRTFSGRIVQLITGSTGLDDYEWGVTLFGQRPDDLKDCVYTMRFDEASAKYAEFGRFYTGVIGDIDEVAALVGLV
ncbi:chlorite dismutase family protein [Acidiferrimicrobium sp. IK]|uniref:chlorite dismutase family protein n=1 Tax=Acidiferrimicrobium sp. IK TaxID=2871700 RepID=UPI0021CB3C6B|nr:chlorite dismutase family protein [Acidiferrimicrobium sp. IK]